jgi:hypothetical protein
MTDKDYLEFQFVNNILKKWGLEVRKILVSDIISKNLVSRNEESHLRDNITCEVKRAEELGGELLFTFPSYGRFIEIHYFIRRQNTSGFSSFRENRMKMNHRQNKRHGQKDTRWYTKNIMGNLNRLIGELMYGFTESVRLDLVNKLSGSNK